MIDLRNVEKYKENNRIEAKKALGGLPHSIWETYSAFANTLGGVILLGVEEYRDKSFHTVNLPDPYQMKQEFWDAVNDPKKVSVNILSSSDVQIQEVNGDNIMIINVPRADRSYKPVYIEGNPLNCYRRSGEGDYKCTMEEYRTMVRDASAVSSDMRILEEMGLSALSAESVREYRLRMKNSRPGHVWEILSDDEFLMKMGAAGTGEDGKMHPTSAGLLLFGYEYNIVRVFPDYFLDYREENGDSVCCEDRICSSSGDWSGNVFDFFCRLCQKLQYDGKAPFVSVHGSRADVSSVRSALREALANCLVNADYYGRGGIIVLKTPDAVSFSNPGSFRIDIKTAKDGGLSDSRNKAIQKLFTMIDIGERTGHGIPNIFRVWREQNRMEPDISQSFEPDRTTLTLSFLPVSAENLPAKGRRSTEGAVKAIKRQMLIDYLTEHIEASSRELSVYLELDGSNVRNYLRELMSEGIVIALGKTKNRVYKLKESAR